MAGKNVTTTGPATSRNVAAEIAYLTRALKAPSLAAAVERLAERAQAEEWSYPEFLAACLQREVAAREAHGGEGRIKAARFPARKSIEEFDFDHQRSLKRETITHLGTLDFVASRTTWCSWARPALARATWRSGWASGPARPATGCCSPPRRNGSAGSPTPTTPGAWKTNSSSWAGSRF
jgi:hypothetical protein